MTSLREQNEALRFALLGYRQRADELIEERDRARAAARTLYHDWEARTVRRRQELAEAEPWILEREEAIRSPETSPCQT